MISQACSISKLVNCWPTSFVPAPDRQAELLEVQAQGLLAEASREKMKRDQMMAKRGQFEQVGSLAGGGLHAA
jgi:hypothetical protein